MHINHTGSWPVFRYLLSHALQLLLLLWPYALVVATFLTLVAINGSIAMGDKTNHTLSFHAPQLLYFVLFTFALSPSILLNIKMAGKFVQCVLRRPLVFVCLMVMVAMVMAAAVHFFTYEHPYLLADNRHYPFYVWKNLFRRHAAIKYLLVPVYAVLFLYMLFSIVDSQGSLWCLCFAACCFTSLVPQKLLEFRYFILPFLILRIHMPRARIGSGEGSDGKSWKLIGPLLLELTFYVILNAVTIWLFLFRPFRWPDSDEQQRFMW